MVSRLVRELWRERACAGSSRRIQGLEPRDPWRRLEQRRGALSVGDPQLVRSVAGWRSGAVAKPARCGRSPDRATHRDRRSPERGNRQRRVETFCRRQSGVRRPWLNGASGGFRVPECLCSPSDPTSVEARFGNYSTATNIVPCFPTGFPPNGVDLRRAGDVNPLIRCDCWRNPCTYVPGSPLEFLKFTPLGFTPVARGFDNDKCLIHGPMHSNASVSPVAAVCAG